LIPSNKAVAKKRLVHTTEKLKKQDKFENYDRIFKDWKAEGIIDV